MGPFITIILVILPVFLLLALGGFLRKYEIIKEENDSSFMQLSIHIFLTALILGTLIKSNINESPALIFLSMGAGIITITFFLLASFWISSSIIKLKTGAGKRTFAVSAGVQNFGYLAIPMVNSLFPDGNASAVLFLHNTGVELAFWTLGIMIFKGSFEFSPRIFLKGPFVAVVLGIALCLTDLNKQVPEFFITFLDMLGACTLPIALLLIGCTLYDLLGKERFNAKICISASILRLIVFPACILLGVHFLNLPLPLEQVLIVQAALPSAMMPIVLAKHYGGQVGVAAQIVLCTTAISLFTIPLVLWIGTKLL